MEKRGEEKGSREEERRGERQRDDGREVEGWGAEDRLGKENRGWSEGRERDENDLPDVVRW